MIRAERTGSTDVTWAEFVEAGYLREYRVERAVSLQKLRRFIDLARATWGVPYPLAHFKPVVEGSRRDLLVLLQHLQEEAQLDDELQLVLLQPETGQLVIRAPFQAFLDKVTFSDPEGVATCMHPLGEANPVVIDPEMSFGIPQVHGIRTETVAEAVATGEDYEAIAATYGLTVGDVHAAVQWELTLRPRPRGVAA